MRSVMYLGPAKVTATSPLAVQTPVAAAPGPATSLGGPIPGIGTVVVVAVRDDGKTYVLGVPPATTTAPTGQSVYLTSPNGSVYRVIVSDAGVLGTNGPL